MLYPVGFSARSTAHTVYSYILFSAKKNDMWSFARDFRVLGPEAIGMFQSEFEPGENSPAGLHIDH